MINKLKKIIFAGIIIFLPSQLGLHFWPNWAYINGVRIDYFSPTLYFTDVLIIGLFVTVIPDLIRDLFLAKAKNDLSYRFRVPSRVNKPGMTLVYCVIGLLVLLNIYFSLSPFVSLYKWLKITELVFLAVYVAKNKPSLKLLIIPVIYSCFLAVWQFVNQGSVGGLWYWLGERTFTFDTLGIAPGRPYTTFSHPNVLAGFLIVSIPLIFKYIPHIYRIITVAIIAGIIFLTLSKGNLQNGWNLRMQLNAVAIDQWIKAPILGTGLGTSPLYPRNITNYALLHQPIHNIFLLVLSETGLLGLLGFLVILKKRWNWFLVPILLLGMFDHYWLTQQQTQLLLALVLGLTSSDML